jgi:hypothetical protein
VLRASVRSSRTVGIYMQIVGLLSLLLNTGLAGP